jgi:hypothetical protein
MADRKVSECFAELQDILRAQRDPHTRVARTISESLLTNDVLDVVFKVVDSERIKLMKADGQSLWPVATQNAPTRPKSIQTFRINEHSHYARNQQSKIRGQPRKKAAATRKPGAAGASAYRRKAIWHSDLRPGAFVIGHIGATAG